MKFALDSPSDKAIHAALHKTTEALAAELARPGRAPPDWSECEWLIARAAAAMHGVSPLLSRVSRWSGPTGWNEFLQDQHAHTLARHSRIEELLQRLDGRARDEGVGLIGLKGVELHRLGLYAAGSRPMGDVDLLCSPAETARVALMLEAIGFRQSFASWKHRVFVASQAARPAGLGEHSDNYLKIELHERLAEALPLEPQDVTRWVGSAQAGPGLARYPSRAALMTHLLLHAAGEMASRSLRLVHLHDLALLCGMMTEEDWSQLLYQSASDCGHWWAFPPLSLTARYYGCRVPARVMTALYAVCPRRLLHLARHRTLSEVSFSYLWIAAFPGIQWTRSARQIFRYVRSRLHPGSEILELRQELATTHLGTSANPWGHLSQPKRILRWMLARQARSETIHPVRMALAQWR